MRLHDIQEEDLPFKIKMSLEKYKKSIKNNFNLESERQKSMRTNTNNLDSTDHISSNASLSSQKKRSRTQERDSRKNSKKSLSTGRSKNKHNINTNLTHISVTGGDMVTVRNNKAKHVNIKKGLENSLTESLSNKSKSNTRNNEKAKKGTDIDRSNEDSMKALDELMGNPVISKPSNNQGYVVQKNKIKFKPIRSRVKNKPNKQDKSPMNKISQATESNFTKGLMIPQSRNKMKESQNQESAKGKGIMKNNFFA